MPHSTRKIIGVIGLGIIGRGVAVNLRRKGFQVYVWNRTPRRVPNFVGSPAELAEVCDYLQIFVSDDEALLQTVEQLSGKLASRHIVIAHSTVAPDSMRVAAAIVERRGARFIEAPLTGSKIAAEKGELVYYVAGNDEALREARPILEASGKAIIEIGEIGQATEIKVATNMVTAASVQATAEAVGLVQALGLPLEKFVEAMEANASHSTTLAMKMPKMIERDYEPHFSVKHMLKDTKIAHQLGSFHDLELAVTATVRDRLAEQMQCGHGDDDYSALARKYLPEIESLGPKETETGSEPQSDTGAIPPVSEPTTPSDLEEPGSEHKKDNAADSVALAPPSGEVKEETQLRRGFLSQLLRRGRQLFKQPVSPREE
jgi:3-hydroxyisobutyrate dehydrogenase-like beta-hydroxyacid dehydrogenase